MKPPYPKHIPWRIVESIFVLADILLLPKLLLWINGWVKPNTRPLTDREMAMARTVFGQHISYNKVCVDERARIGCKQYHFAYVGFHCINTWGALAEAHFIHEMIHVWQYERFGSVYIPRALYAQRTPEGYHYGGVAAIKHAAAKGYGLLHFNYEQQGEIVADYFCLLNGYLPRYCPPDAQLLPFFKQVIGKDLA